ncbi:hypothetical protein Lesp02_75600 [Lentzea sp. NBRC 105346]|uniref:hypothetical protein n=1 Tax=Lentzea sp. NBRC 105346 TaxID=3032205 RepID=UPI0024A22083|nr:hypothetical protein [Lentzea sp. NBRC 105346]GLZ35373.1 hypothetical protein Lesp02_75600 [Lentzea sp. NBRC 105346]
MRLLHLAVVSVVIASSGAAVGYLAVTHDQERSGHEAVARIRSLPEPARAYRYERLTAPARTVVRDDRGAIVATFTDGARTAVLIGPARTFAEPARPRAVATTPSWVRLLPQPWQRDLDKQDWFRPWLDRALADRSDDVLAVAAQYLEGAVSATDGKAVRFRGDAAFGKGDFTDYLGVNWTFPDGTTATPAPDQYGTVDPAGFVRLVYGYRLGYPLRGSSGPGLPRSLKEMASLGTAVAPERLVLQPGDLLFFGVSVRGQGEADLVGIFTGLDRAGRPSLIASRKKTAGPALTDDTGLVLRAARRL